MTQRAITHVDLLPDLSALSLPALEALSDQVFNQLEDGPLIEGLFAFYLSVTAEIDARRVPALPLSHSVGVPEPQIPDVHVSLVEASGAAPLETTTEPQPA